MPKRVDGDRHLEKKPFQKKQRVQVKMSEQPVYDLAGPHIVKPLANQDAFKQLQQEIIASLEILNEKSFDLQEVLNEKDTLLFLDKDHKIYRTEYKIGNAPIEDMKPVAYTNIDHIMDLIRKDIRKDSIFSDFTLNTQYDFQLIIGNDEDGTLPHRDRIGDGDYTITIPIVDFNLDGEHDLCPETTVILPNTEKQKHSHSVKRRLNEQDYMNIPSTEFISDKPKLGTASIMRSTTTGNESDAGESVVHYAPSSKDNSLRVVLIFKANKNK